MIRCSCHGLHGCVPVARERDPARLDELAELLPALAEERSRVGEGVAAAGADLDLRRDQLADEMRLELGSPRRFLELLEAVDEAERLRVDQRELLLDGDREIGHRLERRAGLRQHLLVPELLLLAHAESLLVRLKREALGDHCPAPALLDRAARGQAELAPFVRPAARGSRRAARAAPRRRRPGRRGAPQLPGRPPRRCRPPPRRGPSARRRPGARRPPPPRPRPCRTPRGRSTARRRRRRAEAGAGGGGARAPR